MKEDFKADYFRMTGKQWSGKSIVDLLTRYDLRYLLHIRSGKHILYTLLRYEQVGNMDSKYCQKILDRDYI